MREYIEERAIRIADYIIEENEKRKRENETISSGKKHNLFSLEISKSTMVDYILNFVSKDEVEWDGKLNVLEIQPGKTKNDEPTLTKEMINNLLNQKTSTDTEINIKSMTSAEFVGKIDDLSKYDLIYFGSDIYAFNKDSKGKTVYNDSVNMDGLIYSNIGDIVSFWVEESGNKYSGMLDSDYVSPHDPKKSKELFKDLADQKNQETYATGHNTYRYSGNDLSKETVKKVIDYVKSGCPVLVDKKFYKSDESKTNDKASVDDSLVDNCSYMYELLDTIKTYKNVLTYQGTKTDVDALMKCLLIGKPSLEIEKHEKVNNVTDGETNDFDNVVDNIVSQKFKLKNHGAANVNTDFEVKFYLDMNADGKFSPTQEALPALEVELTKNGDTVIPFSRGEGDNTEYYYEIQPGDDNTYKISYELPEGMVGLIPWKLVVAQKDNSLRTVYQQGYFYNAKKSTDDTTTIHILQIDSKSGSTFNMENQLKNKDSLFYKLLDRVKDFDITVRTISSTTYANEYNAFAANHKGEEDKYFEKCCFDINYNKKEEADMLIIGFADSYKIENADAMNGIISFINSGKPVLFTHDTTSFNNNRYDTGAWGYQFNSKIRNLVGMDRYGVCASPTLTKGAEISESTNKTDYDEVSTNAIKKNLDVAYVPKSGKTRIAKQVQGFSYGFITHYLRIGKSSNKKYLIYGNDVLKTNHDPWQCSKVQQVNEGQITNYPFAIKEEFSTAYTHSQYYQLDYNEDADRDGESDIVVWYTLSGTDAYTCTPRDVRNNYYIYTKGNVTYSGVGHKSIGNQEMELKLYINTMVAAYRSEAKGPKVSLREGPDKDAADLTTLYLSFDEKLGENLESGTKKKTIEEQMLEQGKKSNLVYFTVEDRNIVKNTK